MKAKRLKSDPVLFWVAGKFYFGIAYKIITFLILLYIQFKIK